MKPSDIQPLHSFVLVKRTKKEETTPGGIHLPDRAQQDAKTGTVIAVGPGRYHEDQDQFVETRVCRGQKVLFGRHAGIGADFEEKGEKYFLIDESDLLAVIGHE